MKLIEYNKSYMSDNLSSVFRGEAFQNAHSQKSNASPFISNEGAYTVSIVVFSHGGANFLQGHGF